MIQVLYTLQIDDFMDAVGASYAKDKRGKRIRAAMIVIGIAIVPLVLYTRSFGEDRGLSYWMIPLGLGLAWSAFQSPARRLKSYYKKSVTGEQVTGQFDAGRMVTFSTTTRIEILWSGFDEWMEGDTTFVVFAANMMYVFPKRAFSEGACAEFRRLLGEKIQANPCPKNRTTG